MFYEQYKDYNLIKSPAPIDSYIDSKFMRFFPDSEQTEAILTAAEYTETQEILKDKREMSIRNTSDKHARLQNDR